MADTPEDEELTATHGVVLRAKNGDVIRYDPSGLVMRLSDRVVEDLALRLPDRGHAPPAQAQTIEATDPPEGVDGWNARRDGDWIRFTGRLKGAQGIRDFRKHVEGGDIIADTNGPVLGILGIGGARAALANAGGAAFPHHIVAPADDIGAVGHAGVETAAKLDRFEHIREMTHEALVAQTVLSWRMEDYGPLPLFMARVETDSSATAAELADGKAVENLLINAANLKDAAALMGKKAKILSVSLDFALEDHSKTATEYRDGMLNVMEAISSGLWKLGFDRPLFVSRLESGLPDVAPQPTLDGQWELSWNHGDHRLIHSAPAYMFDLDAYDRPTEAARIQQAEMSAHAISQADTWKCPTLHLAELEGKTIRVTARAAGPLTLDSTDGFALTGCENGAQIKSIAIADDDPQAVLLTLDKSPTGPDLRLAYACAGQPRGHLRDDWAEQSATGATLRRYALPAHLPVTGGRNA
ncbi:hypothetical protein [Gymnodinialimonas hymeniacidonis]|uniref:hypothetical protein n=1 Tax=Gymnodinialimonas hymeniacidonis TaxID=3126508 RepID=UPI0034C6470E